MTDSKEPTPHPSPPPYAIPEGYSESSHYGCPPPYAAPQFFGGPAPYLTAQSDFGGPAPYGTSHPCAPQPYATGHRYTPSPYENVQPYGSSSPYAPATYAAPAPYAGLTTDQPARQDIALGWSMWRFNGSGWELIDDRSDSGASPSTPDVARGKFVGQIVRTPSVLLQRHAPVRRPSVLASEYEISEIVRRAGEVPGYASDQELRWIIGTAAALPPGSIWVEVGAMCGRSFLAAGLSLPPGSTLITVDRFLGQHMRRGQTLLDTYRELSMERLDLRIVMTRSDSVGASPLVPDQSCAVVYIDGDHSGPAVRADVHAWTQKLVPGGMLCGHDYGRPEYPGLTLAVDELPGSAVAVDSIWVWHP